MSRTAAALTSVAVLVVGTLGVLVPHAWEGPVMLTLGEGRGVHVSDLGVVAVAAVVIGLSWRSARRVSRLRA